MAEGICYTPEAREQYDTLSPDDQTILDQVALMQGKLGEYGWLLLLSKDKERLGVVIAAKITRDEKTIVIVEIDLGLRH